MPDLKEFSLEQLALYIGNHLAKSNLEIILVGGACVSIYSHNKYESFDLDLICYESGSKIKSALNEIGFVFNQNKTFTHKDCEYFIEFVTPPITVGSEVVTKFNSIKSNFGAIKLLRPEDCIKDRLAAFFYWRDLQSLDQALMVAKDQDVDLDEIKEWAISENQIQAYENFRLKLQAL
ncbi:MAG: hypothetical protein CVV64_12625 [Candidatus Wallbacteria bacterium HGW-Wallbacteria-1]|jgi:hypothetical protein|uniref:Uncharacterized protein n=1 Tax=Candidatus Wallbacteria bacterium HGW-Wallbacteria-1 TaxID=2013854 RepID=A0A2N1PN64_9BACT|nr:MAG: hypothetical protein CVV64_12625 [Candidatus Wallbacteria bacterium HGW-Wallbacteria-1]